MSVLKDTKVNNNLDISSWISVDGKIINNDILYPIITVSYADSNTIIEVKIRKFNNNSPTLGRQKIHWWISNNRWSYPFAISGTITINNGLNLNPTTSPATAILRTSLTDSNGIYKITIGSVTIGGTFYFMCAVQGITYSESFTIIPA